jgi:hypothetical protein
MLGGTSIGSIGCGRANAGTETAAAKAASKVRPTFMPATYQPHLNGSRILFA